MTRTFEELAGQELDALYQGALFLSGGNARGAETLLVQSITAAFEEYPYEIQISSVERRLEARLVRSFLKHVTGGPPAPSQANPGRVTLPPGSFDGLDSRQLFRAAGAVPAWPRAALWLVLLRRWSYAEAASAMGLERDALVDLLRYRDALIQAVLGSSHRSTGLMGRGG